MSIDEKMEKNGPGTTVADPHGKPPILGIHHLAVQTHDLEASLRLYRDLLGIRIVNDWNPPEHRIVLLDAGNGAHIELVAPVGAVRQIPGETSPLLHLALITTDTRTGIEQVRKAGYAITIEPKDVLLGEARTTIAFFLGPNGEQIEFLQTFENGDQP